MRPRLVYLLFLFSGLAGLIYEIVWGRLLMLTFGNTTQSMVAVITAFLGGLGLGSFIAGRISDRFEAKRLIQIYALLEVGVGLTAAATLLLLPLIRTVYASFSDGSTVTAGLLVTKFLLAVAVLIVPTTLMGGTLPVLSRWVNLQHRGLASAVSWLYAFNTLGATLGVMLSTVVLIERYGLSSTVLIAAGINILVGLASLAIAGSGDRAAAQAAESQVGKSAKQSIDIVPVLVYSLSGLIGITCQVLWTRFLTQSVGTFVYAFAIILSTYLLGIMIGSLLYPALARLVPSRTIALGICQFGAGIMTLASMFLGNAFLTISPFLMVALVILPATIFMGLSFPATVALLDQESAARSVGMAYFGNTVGCIVGGFLASFLLIPQFGTLQSIGLMSGGYLALALLMASRCNDVPIRIRRVGMSALAIVIVAIVGFVIARHDSLYAQGIQIHLDWAKANNIPYAIKEDEVASVFGYSNSAQKQQNLYIDGVPTTDLVGETKMMAHLPVWLHPDPQRVLVICFGMGSTFRSSLSYGLQTDVVDLVPSVPTMMPLFHKDAPQVLVDPNGKVLINDGRNYIFLTQNKYDIVTIDPPPPFNASGTTMLYSKEFYQDIAGKLNPGGIVSQWMWFGSRQDDIAMATASFLEVFPYTTVWRSPGGGGGMYLLGSFTPLPDHGSIKDRLDQTKALTDFQEAFPGMEFSELDGLYVTDREQLTRWVGDVLPVTDDFPRTEYFILRHATVESPSLIGVNVASIFTP